MLGICSACLEWKPKTTIHALSYLQITDAVSMEVKRPECEEVYAI
jgi:hypothetical protein